MKADLKKYKDYTIIYSAYKTNTGSFCPIATFIKSGEKVVRLDTKRTFAERDQALSFALGAAEVVINENLIGSESEIFVS